MTEYLLLIPFAAMALFVGLRPTLAMGDSAGRERVMVANRYEPRLD